MDQEENITLYQILQERRCFKLVCGAGNEDAIEVEKLVALYSAAGANYFDLSARADVVRSAHRGWQWAKKNYGIGRVFMNVSVGLPGDPHVRKAIIDKDKCIGCGACARVCPQNTIFKTASNEYYEVASSRCIGCGQCFKVCPTNAISFVHTGSDLKKILPSLIELGVDAVELHAITEDDNDTFLQWKNISEVFKGPLSICLDRSRLGEKQLINRVKRLIASRDNFTTIVQADGAPMSGSEDDYNTTLQTVATADIVQKANLPVYILFSGGTNSKTTELAKQCGVKAHGVAIGSFARHLVKEYIKRDDFLTNKELFNTAFNIAKDLVNQSLKYLHD